MIKLLCKPTGGFSLLVALGLMVFGCNTEMLQEPQEELLNLELSAKPADGKMHFTANLSGDNEVPARDTDATGVILAHVSKDGTSIHFKLIVANVQTNITGAHFHMGPAGTNAGVVVNLLNISDFPPQTTAPVNGILAEGTITAANLSGALKDKPLSDLISAMQSGNIYTNVHTTTYTGGEIRGQL